MSEREDTIERIERVLKLTHKESITVTIPRLTAERAVSMLKEQEAVKPTVIGAEEHDGHGSWWYVCGNCGQPIDKMDRYCRRCGRAVDWS